MPSQSRSSSTRKMFMNAFLSVVPGELSAHTAKLCAVRARTGGTDTGIVMGIVIITTLIIMVMAMRLDFDMLYISDLVQIPAS
ncbi:hypothetical protein L218DRAFT_1006985 [Marasmius fiardii PR-910]|nr:hypothetical protein L218DRAFT_1006985 [Marasmius fiardii PR-910]